MYGAIYGDLVGSLYEYREFLSHSKEDMIHASNQPKLILPESFISDDTILTLAIAEAYKKDLDYEENLRKYILANSESSERQDYFKYLFSPNMIKWAKGEKGSTSLGNGALSRISPLGNMIESFVLLNNEVIEATSPTHNTQDAIKGALCISNIIYFAKANYSKEKIKSIIDTYFKYEYDFELDSLRTNMKFNLTCSDTMPICLYALFNTENFEDAIRLTLSIGGDTDTNCAIVGSMAEALYGMDDKLKQEVNEKISEEYKKILRMCYK